jgi:hypothetical protein
MKATMGWRRGSGGAQARARARSGAVVCRISAAGKIQLAASATRGRESGVGREESREMAAWMARMR